MQIDQARALVARPRTLVALAIAAGAAAAVVAAAAHAGAPSTAATKGSVVAVRSTTLGRVLVDGRGRTLYLFRADKGRKSVCTGQCATFWPPLTTTAAPRAGTGAKASLLGRSKRSDGRLQVTYAGHPLYRFAQDKHAGQTTGEGIDHFGGLWYAVSAAGKSVVKAAAAPAPTTTTAPPATTTTPAAGGGGGGGYGYGG